MSAALVRGGHRAGDRMSAALVRGGHRAGIEAAIG
ncbi:MAG: hypothetical protein QOG94_240 [Solirubrobacteraceae bacterium]|jgi:hypothetical protein|nr:hypothetical protein [Solirubrobacteraceae bacterium]